MLFLLHPSLTGLQPDSVTARRDGVTMTFHPRPAFLTMLLALCYIFPWYSSGTSKDSSLAVRGLCLDPFSLVKLSTYRRQHRTIGTDSRASGAQDPLCQSRAQRETFPSNCNLISSLVLSVSSDSPSHGSCQCYFLAMCWWWASTSLRQSSLQHYVNGKTYRTNTGRHSVLRWY